MPFIYISGRGRNIGFLRIIQILSENTEQILLILVFYESYKADGGFRIFIHIMLDLKILAYLRTIRIFQRILILYLRYKSFLKGLGTRVI